METKLVLLGTGTPNACPNASGPASAVVVGDRAYLVDFGVPVPKRLPKLILTALMPFARTALPWLFPLICIQTTLPDTRTLFLLHGY